VSGPRVVAFRPPARRRLHEAVAEQLRDAILDGRFPAGRKLPPERELAAEFRVNRTSVREAIKVLEGLGLVQVRQGDGVTVRPLVEASLDLLGPMIFHGGRVDTTLLAELGEVLQPLLLELARAAIARQRPEQLTALRRLRDAIADEQRDREARYASWRELIVLLADMSANRVWRMLARRTRDFLASPPLAEARRRLRRDPARIVPVIDAGLAALEAGRTADAVDAIQRILRLAGDPHAEAGPVSTTTRPMKGTSR
jgi:GntR family transcriptional regulator, transcriptional repressor for pyruvate dehydrogenase complex